MSTESPTPHHDEEPQRSYVAFGITLISVALLAVFWSLDWTIAFLVAQVVVISIVIWQACDPFADAAQWIGETLHVPGSVRGATLDAVASSMPELFSGIFFVLVAVFAAEGSEGVREAGEGYGSALATCAGSAIYNMILIPAFCALFIAMYRKDRPTIEVEPEVLTRDGLWFLGCEAVLLAFLFSPVMYWWMGLVLLGLYVVYVAQLYRHARRYRRAKLAIQSHLADVGPKTSTEDIVAALESDGIRATHLLVDELKFRMIEHAELAEEEEDEPDTAGVLFGWFDVDLNGATAWTIIGVCTAIAAAACYWLVEVTNDTARHLDVPVFFIAVILAAAASSVPDTFLSVFAAQRGDDSGAVSNAFGSNIFDICICLSVPLLVNSYLVGWGPVALVNEQGQPLEGLFGLRVLMWTLSVVTLLIMWHKRQLTRTKALVLCALYGLFMAYAIAGSFGYDPFVFVQG